MRERVYEALAVEPHRDEYPCGACDKADGSPNGFSVCLECSHVIDHATEHDCAGGLSDAGGRVEP